MSKYFPQVGGRKARQTTDNNSLISLEGVKENAIQ